MKSGSWMMLVWRHFCFFHCRKSGRRAFCGGVSQVPRITIRQMKMNRFGPFRTEWATGGRSNESQRMSHQTSLFFCSHPKLKRSYRIKINQNPNQLSEDYNRHLEIVVILLVRPRILIFYVHIVHIRTMFFFSEGHGRTLGTGGAVFVGDPRVHEGLHGCFNRNMDKKQFFGQ